MHANSHKPITLKPIISASDCTLRHSGMRATRLLVAFREHVESYLTILGGAPPALVSLLSWSRRTAFLSVASSRWNRCGIAASNKLIYAGLSPDRTAP